MGGREIKRESGEGGVREREEGREKKKVERQRRMGEIWEEVVKERERE